jgi:hypothetical protein
MNIPNTKSLLFSTLYLVGVLSALFAFLQMLT